jgi:hypothetical protein
MLAEVVAVVPRQQVDATTSVEYLAHAVDAAGAR